MIYDIITCFILIIITILGLWCLLSYGGLV